jgi:succinyl-diaminopimelate desuccinylase
VVGRFFIGYNDAMKNTPADPVVILQDLIRCPSVTPHDVGALGVVEKLLTDAGFTCHRLVFKDQDTPDIDNLFARYGHAGPHICFAGHTDVVPVGDEAGWTYSPFSAEIHKGQIFGRGATDMKGSVAAFAAAAIDYVRENPKTAGSISFLITGDEEGPAINGTVKVLEWMKKFGHVPDHCLVGEPTCVDDLGDTIKVGRRGSLSFIVTVEGKQGHVAYPDKVSNPVAKLARLVDRISSSALDSGNEHFGPSSLQVTTFDVGNSATNVVPARAVAKFNIRFSTVQNYDSLRAWVSAHIEQVESDLGGVWTVTTNEGAEAFITEPGSFVGLVQDAIEEETGLFPKLSTSGGTSDARFIKDYCPVLEFGPTNATMHQVDERISVEELKATSQIYRRIIDRYFAKSA